MEVGEVFWVSIQALNLSRSAEVDCPPLFERVRRDAAESFFDPYDGADGAAVTATTVGAISWQSSRVTADLDIDATGHALDFIGLDGTIDATETDGTLTRRPRPPARPPRPRLPPHRRLRPHPHRLLPRYRPDR